jgi:hypothetical protein
MVDFEQNCGSMVFRACRTASKWPGQLTEERSSPMVRGLVLESATSCGVQFEPTLFCRKRLRLRREDDIIG